MSKFSSLAGALGAFGALAYLMAPLPPETAQSNVTPGPLVAAAPNAEHPSVAASTPVSAPAPEAQAPRDPAVVLVQQLQTELLRLGCYTGAVDGHWSAETQQAMHALGERARVLRPVDTPDYIMLALARSQPSHICLPRGSTTASRQPARMMHMAGPLGGVPDAAPSAPRASPAVRPRTEPPPPRRTTDRTPGSVVYILPRPQQPAASREERPADRSSMAERSPVETPDTGISAPDRSELARSRMSLGVTSVDPLSPPLPATNTPEAQDAAPAPRRTSRAVAETRQAPPKSRRTDWRRTVFSNLGYNGP